MENDDGNKNSYNGIKTTIETKKNSQSFNNRYKTEAIIMTTVMATTTHQER